MEPIIRGYRHESFFRYFEEISRIPRGSGNEAGIAAYLAGFAESRGLYFLTDAWNNVFIRKGATPGYEKVEPILLQGHTDMVCEKNADSDHDFEKDPLDLYVENGLLRARGTTLGGDDGVAVALMLSLLDDETLPHPVLECLFTSGEETGLYGARHFDCSVVTARRMLNLDTEEDGEAIASCAGSVDLVFGLEGDLEAAGEHTLDLFVTGLAGGHSGADIHTGRANAIRLMGRILARLYEDCPFRLVSLRGGNKRNAIPRECGASLVVLDRERARALAAEEADRIAAELWPDDKGFRLSLRRGRMAESCFSYRDTSRILNCMLLPAGGVVSLSPANPAFVRTSANMGVISAEKGIFSVSLMARSSCDSEMDALLLSYRRLAKALGLSYTEEERAGGWDLNPDSKLAADYLRIYRKLFPDSAPKVSAIHAGLECGIFVAALPGCDALSVGPTIYEIHSPNEALDLSSCERFCDLVRAMVSDR